MSRIIWARSGVIVAPLPGGMGRRSVLSGRRDGATIRDAWALPRTSARPEEPQPSRESHGRQETVSKEMQEQAGITRKLPRSGLVQLLIIDRASGVTCLCSRGRL